MPSTLTTRALVQEHLGISTDNDVIDTIVSGVNAGLENFLDAVFASTTYTNEEYDIERATRVLVLKNRPVITFTRLQSKDSPLNFDDNNWTDIDTDDYDVDLGSGLVTWNSKFARGKGLYRATYDAGFAAIPDDLTLGATKVASSLYQNRKNSGVKSETLGQYSRTFSLDPENWKTLGVDFIFQKYKNLNSSAFADPSFRDRPGVVRDFRRS